MLWSLSTVASRSAYCNPLRGVAADTGYGAASNFVVAAARLSALAAGGYLVLTHAITVGTAIAFLGYVGALFGPVLHHLTRCAQTLPQPLELCRDGGPLPVG